MGYVSAGIQALLGGALAAWLTSLMLGPIGSSDWAWKDYGFVGAVVVAVFYNRLSTMNYEKLMNAEQIKKLANAHPFQRIEFIHGPPLHLKVNTVTCILFFGTWDEKSRAALKMFNELRLHYASEKVQYVAFTQESREELAAYEVKGRNARHFQPLNEFGFTIAIEDGMMGKQYLVRCDVYQIPNVFIVGKDQSIVWFGSPTNSDLRKALSQAMEDPDVVVEEKPKDEKAKKMD
ncbi:TPA: hypothetical protein N0F65_012218 [Lagenidium giganteum]|uniref:Thioredoxin domain-containing protein n=1 Tax=Lagenidium giganteum TaxID=4803 RepID=A0AAV2ZFP9_9STRA|nr:TPA: hypothetical protein N0F65_012218 [Lagenidium giganteum]